MKKNNAYLLFFCLIIFNTSLYAQYCDTVSFQKILWNEGVHDATVKNMFYALGGNVYALGSTESTINNSKDIWITKITEGGNIIWSKAIIGMSGDQTINGVRHTTDGGFIIAGTTTSQTKFSEGLLVKTDSNAEVQWAVLITPQFNSLSSVTQLDDGSYIAAGTLYTDFKGDSSGSVTAINKSTNLVMRVDANGNMLWWKSFRHTASEGLKTSTQAKDGSLFVTGIVNQSKDGYIIKLNKDNGAIEWMNEYKNLGNNASPRAIPEADGTVHLQVGNRIFYLNADGKFFGAIKIELNSKKINLDNISVNRIGAIKGTDIYNVNLYPAHSPIVFAVQNDSVVAWAHQYKQTTNNLQRISNTLIVNNSIYIAGVYVTNNLSDNLPAENLTYLIKSDQNGSTLCSDTFNVSFKVKSISYPPDITRTWQNEGAIQSNFINLYTEDLVAKTMLDCDIQNCCKAFLKDTSIDLCKGAYYFLPPNDSLVKTSGNYSFHYYTSVGGCDSILTYNINFKPLYSFHLNDTCLISNQPVTFRLPFDSTTVYKWQDGSSSKYFTASIPGKYWVSATSACNTVRDTVNVSQVCSLPVYIPSAFTPNGDGLNDVFRIYDTNGQHLVSLYIYNRYGQNIYFNEAANAGWDGTFNGIKQASGTYIYIFRYADLEGTLHTLKGTVVLIR